MNNEKQHKEIKELLTRNNDNLGAIHDLIFHEVLPEIRTLSGKVRKLEK